MNKDLVIPKSSIKLILLQRSQYRFPLFRAVRALLKRGGLGHHNFLQRLFEKAELLRAGAISELYYQDLTQTLTTIEPVLPMGAERILDVGAGMGGIDLLLYRKYGNATKLYLLDKEGESDTIVAGFHESAASFSKYNSFVQAKEFLTANGVRPDDIFEINIDSQAIPKGPFGIVISLLSWGFHYPIDTYLDDVVERLAANGILIVDVRKNTNGIERLEAAFGVRPTTLYEGEKFLRVGVLKST